MLKKFKGVRVLALALVAILVFASCGQADPPPPAPADPVTPPAVTDPVTPDAPAEPADEPAVARPAWDGVFPPRNQMLITEPDGDINPMPGNFNHYAIGVPASWGGHQILWDRGLVGCKHNDRRNYSHNGGNIAGAKCRFHRVDYYNKGRSEMV